MEEGLLPEVARMDAFGFVFGVLLPGGKRVPRVLLSCLLVPRLRSVPTREGESGALFRVSSALRGPGAAGLLFPGDRMVLGSLRAQ